MNDFEVIELLERIDQLIRLKATGTPKDLSVKLGISERTVYRTIIKLKERGFPIYYDKINNCYCYEISGELFFNFGFKPLGNSSTKKNNNLL